MADPKHGYCSYWNNIKMLSSWVSRESHRLSWYYASNSAVQKYQCACSAQPVPNLERSPINNLDMNETGIGGCWEQFHDQLFHARQYIMFYHTDHLAAWDRKAYLFPIRYNRSELSYCTTHKRRVRPLPGVSRTCCEVTFKSSSSWFSSEESRKRHVSTAAKLSPS